MKHDTQESRIRAGDSKQIPLQFDVMVNRLNTLGEKIESLLHQLKPVLRTTDQVRGSDQDIEKQEEFIAPFACLLRDRNEQIKDFIQRVDYLNEGLEI